jgi:pimeloyl-ACP methyl ester carboxylesterase
MSDNATSVDTAAAKARDDWYARIEEIGDDAGYFERMGPQHSAFFHDDGPVLLVSFETVEQIRATREDQMPWGATLARSFGWSALSILAEGETWYRHPAVYGYFDRLVDDAFFEDFDRVVFYGAGMGGYAAAAFSVTAPGAAVVAVQPAATLDPLIAEWDKRYMRHRRLDFTDRYGYAPDMVEGAGEVFVIYDPEETLDAMHASLFTKPFVTKLRCRNLGAHLEAVLTHLGILAKVVEAAGKGRFDAAEFWRLYRARREHPPYLRTLLGRLDASSRPRLAAQLCRNVTARLHAPRFKRRLAELEDDLQALGVALPPAVAPEDEAG